MSPLGASTGLLVTPGIVDEWMGYGGREDSGVVYLLQGPYDAISSAQATIVASTPEKRAGKVPAVTELGSGKSVAYSVKGFVASAAREERMTAAPKMSVKREIPERCGSKDSFEGDIRMRRDAGGL